MICPNCKFKYREGFTTCPDCGSYLVEELSEEKCPEPRPSEKEKFLCSAVDEFEADIIIAKLGAEGVFALKKYRGSDSYNKILLGRTVLGVDVFVSESDYEEAKEIVDS